MTDTTETIIEAPPRAYVGDFTIRCGALSVRGRLLPLTRTDKAPKFSLCTPTDPPEPVMERYVTADDTIYREADLGRCMKDKQGVIEKVIDPFAVSGAKASVFNPNQLELTIHPADEVEDWVVSSKSSAVYIFESVIKNTSHNVVPDETNDKYHDILNHMVRSKKHVFIGMCNLNNYEGLFILFVYKGKLAVRQILYPEQIHQYHQQYTPTLTRNDKAVAKKMLEGLTTPFDPESYPDLQTQRLHVVAAQDYEPGKTPAKAAAPSPVDVAAILAESLDGMK